MTEGAATLIAAVVAAAAALLSLVVSVTASRSSEFRAAHREALQPHLVGLGKALHQVLATSSILLKRAALGKETQRWIDRGAEAAELLKQLRVQVRYPLHGLDSALRTLSRMPEWIATFRGLKEQGATSLIEEAHKLAELVDRAVRRSYRYGRPPGFLIRTRVAASDKRVREIWEARFGRSEPSD